MIIPSIMHSNDVSVARAIADQAEYGPDSSIWDEEKNKKRKAAHDTVARIVAVNADKMGGAEIFAVLTKAAAGIDLGYTRDTDGTSTANLEDKPEVIKDAATLLRERDEERGKEITDLTATLESLDEKAKVLERENNGFAAALLEMERQVVQLNEETEKLEAESDLKERTVALLENPEESMEELKKINTASAERILSLAKEWEGHRAPLITKYRQLKKDALEMRVCRFLNVLVVIFRINTRLNQTSCVILGHNQRL